MIENLVRTEGEVREVCEGLDDITLLTEYLETDKIAVNGTLPKSLVEVVVEAGVVSPDIRSYPEIAAVVIKIKKSQLPVIERVLARRIMQC